MLLRSACTARSLLDPPTDSERRFESYLAIHGEGLLELLAGEGYG